VDNLESKDSYLIRAKLPGMKREDFNLEVQDGSLKLSGNRKFVEPANGVEYHRVERVTGKFSRSFSLPHATSLRPRFLKRHKTKKRRLICAGAFSDSCDR
jgi:HSP20 family protein